MCLFASQCGNRFVTLLLFIIKTFAMIKDENGVVVIPLDNDRVIPVVPPQIVESGNGAWVGGVFYTGDQLREAAEEEAAAAAASRVSADWFEYVRGERIDFISKFWKFHELHEFGAKERVWAENLIIAFDQMYEALGLVYKNKRREQLPTSSEEDLMELTMGAMFGNDWEEIREKAKLYGRPDRDDNNIENQFL